MFPAVYNLTSKEIVVGSTLPALIFAKQHKLPLVAGLLEKPQPFERFEPDFDLGDLALHFPNEVLETPDKEVEFGPKKLDVWNWFWFELGLRGLLPGGDFNKSVNITDDKLVVSTIAGKKLSFSYDRIHLFSDRKVRGIPNKVAESVEQSIVYDHFYIRKNSIVPFDFLTTEDNFVSEIWLISNDRFLRKEVKDLIAVSYLDDDQLENFAYSEVSTRYKVLDELSKSTYKKKLKLEHKEREILKSKRNVYYNSERITFHNLLEEELLCPNTFISQELFPARLKGVT